LSKIGPLNEFTTATVHSKNPYPVWLARIAGNSARPEQGYPKANRTLMACSTLCNSAAGMVAQALFAARGELAGQVLARPVISIEPT
jgi:hypothetical protein